MFSRLRLLAPAKVPVRGLIRPRFSLGNVQSNDCQIASDRAPARLRPCFRPVSRLRECGQNVIGARHKT